MAALNSKKILNETQLALGNLSVVIDLKNECLKYKISNKVLMTILYLVLIHSGEKIIFDVFYASKIMFCMAYVID